MKKNNRKNTGKFIGIIVGIMIGLICMFNFDGIEVLAAKRSIPKQPITYAPETNELVYGWCCSSPETYQINHEYGGRHLRPRKLIRDEIEPRRFMPKRPIRHRIKPAVMPQPDFPKLDKPKYKMIRPQPDFPREYRPHKPSIDWRFPEGPFFPEEPKPDGPSVDWFHPEKPALPEEPVLPEDPAIPEGPVLPIKPEPEPGTPKPTEPEPNVPSEDSVLVPYIPKNTVPNSLPKINSKPISTALEIAVCEYLGKTNNVLTESDWQDLESLELNNIYLDSLDGLEKAENLKEFRINFCQIDDILALAKVPNLEIVILEKSTVPEDQLALLKKNLSDVEFREIEVGINSEEVKKWDPKQEMDEVVYSAENIIEKAGEQSITQENGNFQIDSKIIQRNLSKVKRVKEELYAKAVNENVELNRDLENIVKFKMSDLDPNEDAVVQLKNGVQELKSIDRMILEINSEISLELSSDEMEKMGNGDITLRVSPISNSNEKSNKGDGISSDDAKLRSMSWNVNINKPKPKGKVVVSMKTDDNPYNAIFREADKTKKTEKAKKAEKAEKTEKEQLIGGKYNARTRKLKAKISQSGNYYIKNNEKNFADIEGLPTKQKEMIKILASKGILEGSNGKFMPNSAISRSEILTILVRLSYAYNPKASSNFKDVQLGSWYYPYVSSGSKIGVVDGYADNTFKPNNSVNAAEIAKMNTMMLVYKRGYHFPKKINQYLRKLKKGSNIPNWSKAYIAMSEREGFLLKTGDGFYDGNKIVNRQQAAEMLYRLYQKL